MRTCVCYLEIQRSHRKEGNESFTKEGHLRFVSVAFGFHCGRWKMRYTALFLGHLSYLRMPKIKGSQVKFCNTVAKGPQRKPTFALSLRKMVDICRKLKTFFLYTSNNLFHILLQLGTFLAHYTKPKN